MENRRWAVPFFTIWTGQACSLLGSALVQFALVWWLTESTDSATVLAGATFVALLPQVILGPFIGTLVDRWNRRTIMIMADSLIALATVGLMILFAAGKAAPWHVYVMLLVRSLGGGFHSPSMQASTTLMVPREQLTRVAGANQALDGAITIIAPPLGALLIDTFPVQSVLAVDIVTACLAVLPLLFIPVPQPDRSTQAGGVATIRQDFAAGLHYVASWPGLRAVMVLALLIKFSIVPAFSLMPLLVTRHFGGDALELGWLQGALGVGVLLGGVLLGLWGGFERRIVTSMVGLIGMGCGILLLGLTPLIEIGLVAMVFAGIMQSIHGGPLFALLQAVIAPEMQGRALSILSSGMAASAPISLAIAGPLTDALGANVWYILGGVSCIMLGITALSTPVILHIEENRRTGQEDNPRGLRYNEHS